MSREVDQAIANLINSAVGAAHLNSPKTGVSALLGVRAMLLKWRGERRVPRSDVVYASALAYVAGAISACTLGAFSSEILAARQDRERRGSGWSAANADRIHGWEERGIEVGARFSSSSGRLEAVIV